MGKLSLISFQSTSDEVKKLLTAKTHEAIEEGSFGLPWYAGEYLQFGQPWQCVDWQKLQMLKGRKSAFGALITSHKLQIIWDSRDRDPVVLVIGVGEPCYNSTREEYAPNHWCYKTNSRPSRGPPVPCTETTIAFQGSRAYDISSVSLNSQSPYQPSPNHFPSSFVRLRF